MNKIVASIGLAAIGASGLQAVYAEDLSAPASKIWNVSASLRGFYDDNINTTDSGKVSAYGTEVSPGLGVNWEGEATTISANYAYTFKYYDHKPAGNTDKYDQVHTFTAMLQHTFSPRYHLAINDSFVIGQEPDALRVPEGGTMATAQRISGDNIRNYGSVVFDALLTPVLSLQSTYKNTFYDYHATYNNTLNPPGSPVTPSNAGLLNRDENLIGTEGHWLLQPTTTGLVGYKYGQVLYSGDEPISGINGLPGNLMSDERNSRSHYAYLGVMHTFRPELEAALRAGVQIITFYNDPSDETDYSPYIVATVKYTYAPESHADFGFSQSRSASDVASQVSNNNFTRDSDVSLVYGSITHRIAPRLFGSLIGTFQNLIYNGGSVDGDTQQFYQIGVNMQYRFNSYLSAEVGYNYDKSNSDISGQSYDRNRVYIGIAATY